MKTIEIGELKTQPGGFKAFIPGPFPPAGGFDFSPALLRKNEEAGRLIGKLDGVTRELPDMDYFLLMYLRKDAASSSQIEGTQATMEDAIEADIQSSAKIPPDVDDIQHYIKALHYGLKRVGKDDFPLALRFIRELHKELIHNARTTSRVEPGEFRTGQVCVGGTRTENARFVPPPVDEMHRALMDLERFINTSDTVPVIIKAGLIHAQFETIHPFKDGNGRTGRMLINFYLWQEHFLEKPVLFLSSYFKRNRQLYYDKLDAYDKGRVEEWLDFFLDGIIEIAGEAIETVDKITALRQKDMAIVQAMGARAAESGVKVLTNLFAQPIVNGAKVQEWTGFFTRAGVQKLIDRFIEKGILSPRDKNVKYGQSYVYKSYLDIFIGKD
jgi:Fic family protein